MAKYAGRADNWQTVGLKRYPGDVVPPIGDPRLLDDTELLRRIMPVAVKAWNRRPKQVQLDDEALLIRILFVMFKAARSYDPNCGYAMTTRLFTVAQYCWQLEADDARLLGRKGGGHKYRKPPDRRRHMVVDGEIHDIIDQEPSPDADPADFDSTPDYEFEEEEVNDLIGFATTPMQGEAARAVLVRGIGPAEAGRELGLTCQQVASHVKSFKKLMLRDPIARELAGLGSSDQGYAQDEGVTTAADEPAAVA